MALETIGERDRDTERDIEREDRVALGLADVTLLLRFSSTCYITH